ncbi:MAG: Dna2/Cas4 domain-containing protein, partial [Prevotella sp.]|nr:Dna2/Cas4 domain-containing protein [Candidatus Prevotella equi]
DNAEDEDAVLGVTFGRLTISQEKKSEKKEKEYNPFNEEQQPLDIDISTHKSNAIVFQQSNDSRRFADDSIDEEDKERYIRMGTIMHQLFSTIHTLYDVEPALQQMEFDGMLYDEHLTKEKLLVQLRKKFNNPIVKEWFSSKWRVYNECTIITPEGIVRPDRVITDDNETIVIDFKFGKEDTEHHQQVQTYMEKLQQMGHKNVKGFLWYVSLNKTKQIEN